MKKFPSTLLAFIIVTSGVAQTQKIELNLIKGNTYTQMIIANMSVDLSVNGEEMNLSATMTTKINFKVTDINDSVYDMEARYVSISVKKISSKGSIEITSLNGLTEFSSEKNDAEDIVSTILGKMKSTPFLIKMTKRGKVKEISNIDSIFSNIIDSMSQIDDVEKLQFKDQITESWGEKSLINNIEMSTAIFPDHPVSKGDKWLIRNQVLTPMSLEIETTYELKEINKSYYLISGISPMGAIGNNLNVESDKLTLRNDTTGTMSSEIKIDRKSGWIIDSKINQVMKIVTDIDSPSLPEEILMKMTMTMNNEMTVTGKE